MNWRKRMKEEREGKIMRERQRVREVREREFRDSWRGLRKRERE